MNALLVFAKVPQAGHVKTRLTEAISPEDAASLYHAFLADAAIQYEQLGCAVRYHIAPDGYDTIGSASELVPMSAGATTHVQRGADLGERMLNAFVDAFKSGFERIVVIGTDHPTLPIEFVGCAFDELETTGSLVVGPATDGGYYLLGLNELYPTLFQGMRFSHGDVFDDTLARASTLNTRLVVLPEWSDVDTPNELISLYHSFWPDASSEEGDTAAVALRSRAPHTAKEIQRFGVMYGWAGA